MQEPKIPQTGEPDSPPLSPRAQPSSRILVVEDDSEIRELSATVLTRSGYQVDVAEDGHAGWEAIQAKRYDLLITDNNMPKISGVELVKKLRTEGVNLRIIMASGTILSEESDEHPQLQLAAILPKPFTVEELLGTVKKVLCTADFLRTRAEI